MKKFINYADDGKIIGKEVDTEEGVKKVQANLGAASEWVDDWLMQLNDGKCAVVHIRKRNPNNSYMISKPDGTRAELQSSVSERDLGVKVDNELAFNEHIRATTSKANSVIGMLKNTFVCRDVDMWIKLYVLSVRSECLETTTS